LNTQQVLLSQALSSGLFRLTLGNSGCVQSSFASTGINETPVSYRFACHGWLKERAAQAEAFLTNSWSIY